MNVKDSNPKPAKKSRKEMIAEETAKRAANANGNGKSTAAPKAETASADEGEDTNSEELSLEALTAAIGGEQEQSTEASAQPAPEPEAPTPAEPVVSNNNNEIAELQSLVMTVTTKLEEAHATIGEMIDAVNNQAERIEQLEAQMKGLVDFKSDTLRAMVTHLNEKAENIVNGKLMETVVPMYREMVDIVKKSTAEDAQRNTNIDRMLLRLPTIVELDNVLPMVRKVAQAIDKMQKPKAAPAQPAKPAGDDIL